MKSTKNDGKLFIKFSRSKIQIKQKSSEKPLWFCFQTDGPWSNIYWSGSEFSWDQKHPAIHYLFYELSNHTDSAARGRLDDFLKNLKTGESTPNGFRFLQKWGSARHNMNSNLINLIDAVRRKNVENIEFALDQLSYILGTRTQGKF